MANKTKTQSPAKGNKGGMSKIAIGAAGAVVGAAIGGAAATALASDRNRKKLGNVVETVGEYATDAMDAVQENMETVQQSAQPTTTSSRGTKKTSKK